MIGAPNVALLVCGRWTRQGEPLGSGVVGVPHEIYQSELKPGQELKLVALEYVNHSLRLF